MNHPMEEDNSLLHEIESDLQRQRLEALWNRFGPALLVAAALIVIATASITGWRNHVAASEQKETASFMEVMNKSFDKTEDKIAAFDSLAKEEKGSTQAVLAQLQKAALLDKEEKKAEAIAQYDALAADTSAKPIFRSLATLLSVQDQLDDGDPAKLAERLQPLQADDNAWRFSATEYAGYLALRAGDKEKAKALFEKLVATPGASPALVQRATDILTWMKG